MTGPGRPYIGRTAKVRLPDQARDALEAAAEFNGVPFAQLARDILCQWVTDHPDLVT